MGCCAKSITWVDALCLAHLGADKEMIKYKIHVTAILTMQQFTDKNFRCQMFYSQCCQSTPAGAVISPFRSDAYSGRTDVVLLRSPDCSGADLSPSSLLDCLEGSRDLLSFNPDALLAVRCDGKSSWSIVGPMHE